MDMATKPESPNLGNPTKPVPEYCTNSSSNTSPAAAAAKIFSVMAISAPLLYVSFLHVSPSSLFHDTNFWFLMSNAIILVVLAADSGMFDASINNASASVDEPAADLYQEYVNHGRCRSWGSSVCSLVVDQERRRIQILSEEEEEEEEEVIKPTTRLALVPVEEGARGGSYREEEEEDSSKVIMRGYARRRSMSEVKPPLDHGTESKKVVLRRSTTEMVKNGRVAEEAESDYSTMSDEELNRRVEEFIRKFNTEIRRQQMGNKRE